MYRYGRYRHSSDDDPPKFKYCMAFPLFTLLGCTIFLFPGLWDKIRKFPNNETYIIATCFIIIIGSGFCLFLKFFLYFADKNLLPSVQEKCRRDLIIGYGGLAICGMIPQIATLLVGWNQDWGKATVYSSVVIANLSPGLFYPLFIAEHLNYYQLNNKKIIHKQRWWMILAHIGYLVFASVIICIFGSEETEDYPANVVCVNFVFVLFFSSCTAECFVVWKNGIWIKTIQVMEQDEETQTLNISRNEEPSNLVPVDSYELEAASQNPFKCNICLAPYSNLVTPRMLVGCGHTVCEECVAKLPRNEQYTAQVICPFCRKPTRMPCGLPSELPKNYAAFGGNLVVNTDKY